MGDSLNNTPTFCGFTVSVNTNTAYGEAIINGEKGWIVHDRNKDRWYEAVCHGSFWSSKNYEKTQEVFWDEEAGWFKT
jgi:hypothetical protein